MKFKKRRLFLLTVFLIPFTIFSQQPANYTIYGVVTDSASNQPLEGVMVEVINEADTTEKGTAVTDSGGNYSIDFITDVQHFDAEKPTNFKLSQNYPNPFNPSTIIGFQLPKVSDVQLVVYNILGQKIKTIVNQKLATGIYSAIWDGTNDAGLGVAAGVYFYRIYTDPSTGSPKGQARHSFFKTRKMVLLDGNSGGLSNSFSSILRKKTNNKNLQKSKNMQVTIRAVSPLIHTYEQNHINITFQNFNFDIVANLFRGYIDSELIIISEPGLNGETYISGLPLAVTDTSHGRKEISALNQRTLDKDTASVYSNGGFPIMIIDGEIGDNFIFNFFLHGQITGDPIELIVNDSIPPSVIDSKPTNGDKDIPLDNIINVNFSEPFDSTTVDTNSFVLTDSLGISVPGIIGFNSNFTSAYLSPTDSLEPHSKYTITVTRNVTDLQGLLLDTTYIASFTTGDTGGLTLPALNPITNYVAGKSGEMVYIWELDGSFARIWSGSIEADMINSIAIGDFDGGNKELFVERSITRGNGSNSIKSQELLIFKTGDLEPSEIIVLRQPAGFTDALWDMKIANVDEDPNLEIILVFRDQLEVWEYDQNGYFKADSFYYFDPGGSALKANTGDFDNDGVKEIVLAFTGNMWRSFKYNGSSISLFIESSSYTNESGSLGSIDISDINNDGTVEVIGGSSCTKLLLWNHPYISEDEIVVSPSLGPPENAPSSVVVGNLDNNLANGKEIISGCWNNGGIHLFHYDDVDSSLIYEAEILHGVNASQNGIILSDYDEIIIIATSNGLEVFNYQFVPIFNDDLGVGLGELIYQ